MRRALLCGTTSALLIGACATDGPLRLPEGPPSAGVMSTASSPGTTAAGSPGGAARVAPSAISAVQIGQKKVELVAMEYDLRCEHLVQPFEPSDNVGDLMALGAELAGQNAGKVVMDQLQNLQTPGARRPAAAAPGGTATQTLRRAALRMNWMPMALEQRYGKHLLEQMEAAGRLMPRESPPGRRLYPQADGMLQEVLAGVKSPHAYQFVLHISKESGENAMALPGGLIVIDKALVEKPELRDKAYFALAHEVSHVLQRHQTRAMQARVIDSLSLKATLPDMVKTIHQAHSEPQAVMRLLVGGKLLFEKHAVSQELQSDACAVRVLDGGLASNKRLLDAVQSFANSLPKAGPEAPGRTTLAQNNAGGTEALANLVDLVSRPVDAHPTTGERVKNLGEMLVELRKRPGSTATARAPSAPAARPRVEPLPTIKPKS
ncbi:MAG: M48 family metalloprotease [Burkholderiaceae bacterium]